MPLFLLRTLLVTAATGAALANSAGNSPAPSRGALPDRAPTAAAASADRSASTAARRWNATGHEVIAAIAWNHMTPAARTRAAALLRNGPPQAHFTDFDVGATPAERDRNLFVVTSTWADVVRNRQAPSHVYDRGNWHYADYFWKETNGKLENLPDLGPGKENALESLRVMQEQLGGNAPDSVKAIALAWIEHLTGDVHQPLHLSARVTPEGPKGDRGGNDFKLGGTPGNLHSYWDGILDLVEPHGDDLPGAVARWASQIEQRLPMSGFTAGELDSGPDTWGRESLAAAQRELYPATLIPNERPSDAYRRNTQVVSERRMALAGYRLARVLNRGLR